MGRAHKKLVQELNILGQNLRLCYPNWLLELCIRSYIKMARLKDMLVALANVVVSAHLQTHPRVQ